MLKRVEVPFPIYTPLPQLWLRQGPESIPSPAGLATGAHGQLSDSTAGAVPLPLGDPGDRLPGSAAGRPQPGPMQSPFPQSRFWFLPELQLLLHRGCACAWPWTLLIQTQIQTCSLSSWPDLRPVLSLWTCLETQRNQTRSWPWLANSCSWLDLRPASSPTSLGGDLPLPITRLSPLGLPCSPRSGTMGQAPALPARLSHSALSHHLLGSSHPALCPDRLLLLRIFFSAAFGLSQPGKFFYCPQLPFLHAFTDGKNLRIKSQNLLLENAPVKFLLLIYSCAFLKLRTWKMKTVISNLFI